MTQANQTVLILASTQELGRDIAQRLGHEEITLWNDYCTELLTDATLPTSEEETNITDVDVSTMIRTKALSVMLKQATSDQTLPKCLLVVGEHCQDRPGFVDGFFKPDNSEYVGLPGIIYFLFDQRWEVRGDDIILARSRSERTGLTLEQYLAKQED